MAEKTKKVSISGLNGKSSPFSHLLIIVILSSAAFFPFIFDSFTVPKILVASLGLLLFSIHLYRLKLTSELNKLPIWLSCSILLYIIFLVVSWQMSGVPLLRGLFGQFGRGNGLFYYFFAILIFVFSAKTFSLSNKAKLHQLITYFSWSMALYALLQKIGIDIASLETGGLSSVVLTFGNSNFAGGMLSVLFTYHFIECINSKSFGSKNISLLSLILMGTAFSGAFQGYLIILFALCLGATLYVYQKSKTPWIIKAILLAWLLGLFSIALGMSNKFILASVFARETFQARVQYWQIGLEVMKDHLLFGVGPDKLFDVTANYMSPGSLKIITSTRMDNAHNWYLNFGANFGLLALLVQLLILGYALLVGMKIIKDSNTKSDFPIAIFAAFIAIFIDGLVSIEQPGLGFWLYFFAGVTVGSSISLNQGFAPDKIAKIDASKNKRFYFHQTLKATSILVLLISTILISTRVIGDTLLRKSIQTQLLNRGSDSTLQKIGSLAESLKSDPEYSAQALNVLAAAGDAKLLDSVSEASYRYNEESIQATLIRADVLRALGRINEACPLRITLINNTPWDTSQLSKYLICLVQGLKDPNYRDTLLKASVYVPSNETKQIPFGIENELYHLNQRFHDYTVVARLSFLLEDLGEASQHKTYALKLLLRIQELESSNGITPAQPDRKDDLTLLNF